MTELEKKAFEMKLAGDQALVKKAGEIGEAVIETAAHGYETIEAGTVKGYKVIEKGVVSSYKKIESEVVGAYKKIEDAFVAKFLTHESESVEDAKMRLIAEQSTHVTVSNKVRER